MPGTCWTGIGPIPVVTNYHFCHFVGVAWRQKGNTRKGGLCSPSRGVTFKARTPLSLTVQSQLELTKLTVVSGLVP